MPSLTNPKQEQFALLRSKGVPLEKAYRQAGYCGDPGAAHRMSKYVNVRQRIEELQEARNKKNREVIDIDITKGLQLAAEIVTTPISEVTPGSWLCQEQTVTYLPNGAKVVKTRMPSKMDALRLIGRWNGFEKERIQVSLDPLSSLVQFIAGGGGRQ